MPLDGSLDACSICSIPPLNVYLPHPCFLAWYIAHLTTPTPSALLVPRFDYSGIYDEDTGYSPVHPDEEFDEDEEEDEEVDILQQFTEVSEIRFPGEIGPMGDRRLCKIRCVKGKWVGPLCATNEEGK